MSSTPSARALEQAALIYGPLVLMLDLSLNIHDMFDWGRAELLVPQTPDGAMYLPRLPAPILGRGALAVRDGAFVTLARLNPTSTAPGFADPAWKLAFLVPVSELTDRWTASRTRLVPY